MSRETAQYNKISDAVEKLKSDAAQIEESIQEYAKTTTNIGESGEAYSGTVAAKVEEVFKVVEAEIAGFKVKCDNMSNIINKSAAGLQEVEEAATHQAQEIANK